HRSERTVEDGNRHAGGKPASGRRGGRRADRRAESVSRPMAERAAGHRSLARRWARPPWWIPAARIRRAMPVPWLQIIDTLIGLTDLARLGRRPPPPPEHQLQLDPDRVGGPLGGLETRLAGVVVAALKEAFDRDTHRLELERAELEAERERAERALRLELRRQAGDREI